MAVDIFDEFKFSRYCKHALGRGSTNSNHMINSLFYRALWVGFLYVVIEGVEWSNKENEPRLVSYELYYDEIVDLGKCLDKPFTEKDSKYSRRKVLKDFRNSLFYSQKDIQNSLEKRNLEIKFPNNGINVIMLKIDSIFLDFRNRQSKFTKEIPNNYLKICLNH